MNFLKRAFLSVKARKGKSILQIFVFTVICVLVLAGLSTQTAAEKSGDLARQKLGADVTLQADMEKLREQAMSEQSGGERVRFQSVLVPLEAAEELASYEQIKGYNFYSSTTGLASNFEPIESESADADTSDESGEGQEPGRGMPGGMMQGDVSLQGVAFTDSVAEFRDGTSAIVEGSGITEEHIGKNVTLIEQTLAEENELGVGDKITVTNPRDETAVLEFEIIGIYQTASAGSDQAMDFTALNPYNKLYVPYTAAASIKGADYENSIDSAIYYIDDPAEMQSFIDQAKRESSIDFETFKLDADDQLYQQMVGPIENVASFSNNIVYLVSIAGAIILGLIVMMSIRERKYEMGVLLAIGEKRWKLAGQFIAEILVVAVLSLGIATASGNVVAGQLGDKLLNQELASAEQTNTPESFRGRGMGGFGPGMMQAQASVETVDELNVQVTTEDLGFLALIGLVIAAVSVLLPSLSVLRLQPKAILSKQD
ncbi:ABC transporter permease [Bacillus sp. ISL-47]|uniref:ABC transporter permease n=1 Tax=Bacillus sp. ISL-47 TaxID=2819130 RepID=UPI001BE731AF|nr:ABC transporter permease [Bacillus sp. ISL-47]MBT2690145.1 ABC transporter permease [Bacillus sp. ISL-47]MBT2709140.1 ABC transporter permease [Pseudomonas sp. ISL-84]